MPLLWVCLLPMPAPAESLLGEGLREFEELRLRQLMTVQNAGDLAPFSSDGCSGNLSSGWRVLAEAIPGFGENFGARPPWEHCCVAHDRHYWDGAATEGYALRLEADRGLQRCVVSTGERLAPELARKHDTSEDRVREPFRLVADVMYRAVRLGGQPCSLLPWRWGYGWPGCAFAEAGEIARDLSDIKFDEHLVFYDTHAWFDAETGVWHVPIHAWIYEPEESRLRLAALEALLESSYGLAATAATEHLFRRRANLLLADNERGKRVVVRIAGEDVELPPSAENGHVHGEVKLPVARVDAFDNEGRLQYFALTRPGDSRRFEGSAYLLEDRGFGVISDIDDTVKISEVEDFERLFDNTFFKPFRAVDGMAEFYRQLAASGASLHFVSSSPAQLHQPLREFLERAGFPRASIDLKAVRFRDQSLFDLFRGGSETKPAQIEPILRRYPGRRFVLVGDSGEQDPEVYGSIARAYPAQIAKILIRNVDGSLAGSARYRAAFRDIAREKWQIFGDADEISASALLANIE